MIGDQYAVARRVPARRRESGANLVAAVTGSPQRLLAALGRSDLVQLMLAMSLFAGALLLYLVQAGTVSVIQLNISVLQSEQTQLNARVANLQAEQSVLTATSRIQTVATNQLHMAAPAPSNTIWVQAFLPAAHRAKPDLSIQTAARDSQPLAEIQSFLTFVRSSL